MIVVLLNIKQSKLGNSLKKLKIYSINIKNV